MDQYQSNKHVESHGISLPNGQIVLTKPLFVFKKVFTYDKSEDSKYAKYDGHRDKILDAAFHYDSNFEEPAIANLVLPVGTVVNLAQTFENKMRASKAYCWNIVRMADNKEVEVALSGYSSSFAYYPTKDNSGLDVEEMTIIANEYNPIGKFKYIEDYLDAPYDFSMETDECAEGIHFFLEVSRAKAW